MLASSAVLFLILESFSYAENSSGWLLLGNFDSEWKIRWKERVLADRANRYRIVNDAGQQVLNIISDRSASGFWHEWKAKPIRSRKLTWRWKIEASLTANSQEREKKGDDYAARVFVVFEPHYFNWKTKSICYVWAGQEPAGSVYRNPFSASVGQIVLQSGNKNAGKWTREERDFVADYKHYFKKDPTRVSAFAIMVDTDNTNARANAWFHDLKVDINR